MKTSPAAPLSHRDRAVLRAVADGRCEIACTAGCALVVDGRFLTDQFAGSRLTAAGLIDGDTCEGPARLTASGAALLEAA
jgi:hypothetical protein